jgi:hypothetical protein
MKKFYSFLLIAVIINGCSTTKDIYTSSDITVEELKQHVKYLASDELEGRKSGSKGNEIAARYIADQFKSYGLLPAGDNQTYFQNFNFVSDIRMGQNNLLAISIGEKKFLLAPDVDYRPMAFSSDTSISGSLAFVGYGISADTLHYNDYENIDVKGKVVIILRYSPDGKDQASPFSDYTAFRKKIMIARDKGALGVIFVNGPVDTTKDVLQPLQQERGFGNAGIAAIQMKQDAAQLIFEAAGKDLKTVQSEIDKDKKPHSFDFANASVQLQTNIEKIYSNTANVIGYLPGSKLKDEYIVIGAHFDHLGLGGQGSGSLLPDTTAVHNGADDNASGAAGLLEVAQYVSARGHELNRTYIFTAFTGEELGLLGSAHYVKNPVFPLEKTGAMINMDMIGRLKDSALTVQGIGTSPIWKDIVSQENIDSTFKLKLGQDGFGSSDHASFTSKEIPVLFFFTGLHSDYHKPSDDWDLINYEGEKLVTDYVVRVIKSLDTLSEKPIYTKVEMTASQREGAQRGFRVSFGIMPDFGEDAQGMKISGTRANSPAEKAGLKSGDIIIKFGGKDIKNIYDLTYLLGEHKPGDEVEVIVLRGQDEITMKAKLEAR